MFARALSMARAGGRQRAMRMLDQALAEAEPLAAIRDGDTLGAQLYGLLHLMGGHFAARDNDANTAEDRLDEAERIAMHTGEHKRASAALRPGQCTGVAGGDRFRAGSGSGRRRRVQRESVAGDLDSKDRAAALHFDLARCWSHAQGTATPRPFGTCPYPPSSRGVEFPPATRRPYPVHRADVSSFVLLLRSRSVAGLLHRRLPLGRGGSNSCLSRRQHLTVSVASATPATSSR